MDQQIKTSVGVIIILIIAITAGFFTWKAINIGEVKTNTPTIDGSVKSNPIQNQPGKACTQEAKQCPDGSYVSRTGQNCEFAACLEIVGIKDKIIISSPGIDEKISSPISVSGKARGTWFSEGSFPVEIYDGNNKLLGIKAVEFSPVSNEDTWMTEDFVNFKGEIPFSKPSTESGYIIFRKDNPSDQRELDESFKLSVKFEKDVSASDWKIYKNENYGFEFQYLGTMYKETQDKDGWPHSVVLLVPVTHQAQSYELAVEIWNKEADFWKEYPLANSKNAKVVKAKDKYISLWSINEDEELKQTLQSLKAAE